MAQNSKVSLTVDILGNVTNINNSLKSVQSNLAKLNLPPNISKNFASIFSKLEKEIEDFQLKANSTLHTMSDMKSLEKNGSRIIDLYRRLGVQVQNLNSLSDKQKAQLIPSEALSRLTKLEEGIKQYRSTVEGLTKSEQKQTAELDRQKAKLETLRKEKTKINNTPSISKEESNRLSKDLNAATQAYNDALIKLQQINAEIEAALNDPASKLKKNADGSLNKTSKLGKQYALELEKAQNQVEVTKQDRERAEVAYRTRPIATTKKQGLLRDNEKAIAETEQAIARITQEIAKIDVNEGTAQALEKLKLDLKDIDGIDTAAIKSIEDVDRILQQIGGESADAARQEIQQLMTTLESGESSADKFKTELVETRETFEQMVEQQSGIDNLKRSLASFFSVSGAIQIFRKSIRDAFDTVKELDSAMTETAVVTDFSVGDMWEQLPTYTAMANELGATIQGSYETLTLFYQQGLDTNQAIQLGTETMKMARIANLDYATATDYMTAALRGFNMELNETSAQHVNDVYSELAAVTASDTEEISIAMTKTASIANNANMELETTAALLSQIIETTREAPETAGTAMKTIIARFQELKKDPSEIGEVDGEVVDANKIEGALRSIGVALRDSTGQFRDLDDVFLEIASKWDDLDTNTQRYIATMAAGSRQQSRFIAMMSDYDRTMELVAAANNSAGASQEQFDKTLDSMQSKLNELKNAWDSFVMGLSNSAMIKAVITGLTTILEIINKLTNVLGSGTFFDFLTTLTMIIGALKVGKGALGGLFASVEGIRKIFSKENIANNTEAGVVFGLGRVKQSIKATFRDATAEGVTEGMHRAGITGQNSESLLSDGENNNPARLADQGKIGKVANKVLKPFAGGKDITAENATQALRKFSIAITGSIAVIKGVQAASRWLIDRGIETASERFEKLNIITSQVSTALSEIDNKLANISQDKDTLNQNALTFQVASKHSAEYKRAVRQTNQIVRDMLQEFPEALRKGQAVYKDGIWKVTDEFWEEYENKLSDQQQKLEQTQQYLNIQASKLQYQDQIDSNFKTSGISGSEKDQMKKSTSTGAAIVGATGAVSGAAIGATIGSGVPVLGSIIGAAIGALIGAAVGYVDSHDKAVQGVDDSTMSTAAKIFGEHGYSLNEDNAKTFGKTDEEKEIKDELESSGIEFDDLKNAINGSYSAFNSLANSALLLEASQQEFRDSLIDSSEALEDIKPGKRDKVANYAKDMLTQDQIDQVDKQRRASWEKLSKEEKAEYIRQGMENNGATLQKGTESIWLDENNNEYSDAGKDEVGLSTYIQEGYEQAAAGIITAIGDADTEIVDAIYNVFGKKKPTSEDNKSSNSGTEKGLTKQEEQELLTEDLTSWQGGTFAGSQKLDTDKMNDWFDRLEATYEGLDRKNLAALVNKDNTDDLTLKDIQQIQSYLQGIVESDKVETLRRQDERGFNTATILDDTELGAFIEQIGNQKSKDGAEIGSGNQLADAINNWLTQQQNAENGAANIDTLKTIFSNNSFADSEGIKIFLEQLSQLGILPKDNTWDLNQMSENISSSLGENPSYNKQPAALAEVEKEATASDVDPQQLEQYAAELQKVTEGLDAVQAAEMALDNIKLNEGLSEIIASYDDWSDLLDSTTGKLNTTTPEAAAAFGELKKSTEKMLNVSGDLSDSFFENAENMENLKKAAKGDMEAIESLQKAAAKDILFGADFDEESLTEEQQTLTNMLNDFNPDDIKIGASLDDTGMTAAFNDLILSGQATAEQVTAALEGIGFEPELSYEEMSLGDAASASTTGYVEVISDLGPPAVTEKIPVSSVSDTNADQTVKIPVINGKGTKFKGAPTSRVNGSNKKPSGGGGSGGGSKEKYKNEHDKRYNLVQDITEEQRTLNKLHDEQNKLLDGTNTKASALIENYEKQIASLQKQKKLNQEMLKYRTQDFKEYLSENSKYSKYATYNWEDHTVEINWDELNKITDSEEGQEVDDYISKLEDFESKMDEAEDTLMDIDNQIEDLTQEYRDAYVESLNTVRDAIVEAKEKEIDKLNELNDTIDDQNSRMFDAIEKAIDEQRQARENDKTEKDLADKQNRLAALQMDTSGGNELEILQLQKEIDDAKQDYQDSLIDQQLQRMQDDADEASEQRQRQIDLLENQLEISQSNGDIWKEVYDLWNNGFTSSGKLDWSSPLGQLLRQQEDYAKASDAEKVAKNKELSEDMAKGLVGEQKGYYKDIDYSLEIQAAEKGTVSKQTGIDYSQLSESERKDKLQFLESQRNEKIDALNMKETKTYKYNEAPKKQEKPKSSTPAPSTPKTTQPSKPSWSRITSAYNQIQSGKWGNGVDNRIANGKKAGYTEEEVRLGQKYLNYRYSGKTEAQAKKLMGYKTGGLADFTGPAWLDGTKSHPELVLNAKDTDNFIQLKNILSEVMKSGNLSNSENSGDNYYEVHIEVEKISDDYDVEDMASKIKNIIQQDAMYRNVNFINHLR